MHMKFGNKERIERRISAATSIALCVLTVIVQIGVVLVLTNFLQARVGLVYTALVIAGMGFSIHVYLRSGSPSYKLIWMCLLLALPVSGMLLFLLWGGGHQSKNLSLKRVSPNLLRESERVESDNNIARLGRQSPEWSRLAAYLQKKRLSAVSQYPGEILR